MKRGAKPKGKINIKWNSNLAYAIGLIASDGNLSPDKRHICFTSKEIKQIDNFQKALGIKVHIGKKSRDGEKDKKYFVAQFSDTLFYNFLLFIGLTPAKSKTIGKILIPKKYFFDFLRGCFDGDGCSYSYWDPRWKSSFMFYLCLTSASKNFIEWIREELDLRIGITGHIGKSKKMSICYQLKYAKKEAMLLTNALYKNKNGIFLKRKKLKIDKSLAIISRSLVAK